MADRVLLISYYAPPYGGVGSFRPIQFFGHLPDMGWDCTLLTTTVRSYERDGYAIDPSIADILRSGRVVRVPFWGPYTGSEPVSLSKRHVRTSGIRQRIGGAAATLASPDRHVTWLPMAITKGARAAAGADVIYAQGPPFSNHLVGVALRRLTGTPLVAMFEDPWIGMEHRVWRSGAQRRLQARQERQVVRRSDLVLAGTDGFRRDLERRHPAVPSGKFRTLRMGARGEIRDSKGAGSPGASAEPRPLRLLYTGSLRKSPQYDAAGLFRALADLTNNRRSEGHPVVTLTIYGNVDAEYERLCGELGLDEEVVRFEGFQPSDEVDRGMQEADTLVLLIGGSVPGLEMYTSGKLYEYMAARRPILGLVPPNGEAATLIRRHDLGLIAPPEDPQEIGRAIQELRRDLGSLTKGLGDVGEYSGTAIAEKAAELLAEAAGMAPGKRG